MNLQKVSIIRNRGQLTIPDQIRKAAKWLSSDSAVSVTMVKASEIIIRPHKKEFDKKEILRKVKKAQAIKGRGTMSAAEFLEIDRASH